MKNIFKFWAIVAVVILSFTVNVAWFKINVAYADTAGSGTEEDPYQITNCYQLQEMHLHLSSYHILMNDIDCSGTATWNEDPENPGTYFGFEPIGDYYSEVFSGALDGKNHTISGLYINRTEGMVPGVSEGFVGLFGDVRGSSFVKN